MRPTLSAAIDDELRTLQAADRLRTCPGLAGASRITPTIAGAPFLSFCSNDYLGLASHPALARAAAEAATRSGFGAGASRLVAGDLPEHNELESALAHFLRLPAALLFPTGYQANLGVLTALAGSDDLIVSDAANHASLIDGCRLSRAKIAVYPHLDVEGAQAALASPGPFRRRLLVTESLFSMDGDVAPLRPLAAAAEAHDAAFVVDEAHALGVLGPAGRGLCQEAGVEPDVLIGTLGKAFGCFGGFAAGAPALRALLVNRARTFIFTTAPPPPLAAAASAALDLVSGTEGALRRNRLFERIAHLHSALAPASPAKPLTPIIPVIVGGDRAALAASASLRNHGLFVPAIRPPTVPPGTARLRVTLSAQHEPVHVDTLVEALRHTLADAR